MSSRVTSTSVSLRVSSVKVSTCAVAGHASAPLLHCMAHPAALHGTACCIAWHTLQQLIGQTGSCRDVPGCCVSMLLTELPGTSRRWQLDWPGGHVFAAMHGIRRSDACLSRWAGGMRGAVSVALVYFYYDSDAESGCGQDCSTIISMTLIVVLFSTLVFGAVTKPMLDVMLGAEGAQPPHDSARTLHQRVLCMNGPAAVIWDAAHV